MARQSEQCCSDRGRSCRTPGPPWPGEAQLTSGWEPAEEMTGHRTRGAWGKLNVAGTRNLTGKDGAGRQARAWKSAHTAGAGAAGTHLCSGKTVLAGVEARSEQQEDGAQVGGGWTNPGKRRGAPSQGMRQKEHRTQPDPRLCPLLCDPRYVM